MSEKPDKHDKIHDPTPKRLQKQRQEGNVFRAKELVSVGLLASGMFVIFMGIPFGFSVLKQIMAESFTLSASISLTPASVAGLMGDLTLKITAMMMPFLLMAVVVAISLNVVQSGWNFTMKPLMPKPNKLSPLKGLKRIFSAKGAFELLKGVSKIIIIGPIAYFAITNHLEEMVMMPGLELVDIFGIAGRWVVIMLGQMVIVLLLLTAVDFIFQKKKHVEEMKMSTKEIKDESKESEGSPELKSKRRQLALKLVRRPRLDHAVLSSDVVITNPTHYAVALKYDAAEGGAPRVVVKGIRRRALRIRSLALERKIPVVENPPLARALYSVVPENTEIPPDLYAAVATILAEVYKKKWSA